MSQYPSWCGFAMQVVRCKRLVDDPLCAEPEGPAPGGPACFTALCQARALDGTPFPRRVPGKGTFYCPRSQGLQVRASPGLLFHYEV